MGFNFVGALADADDIVLLQLYLLCTYFFKSVIRIRQSVIAFNPDKSKFLVIPAH